MGASAKVIDFSNVKDSTGINKSRIPSGDYLATIISVSDAKARDNTFQYLFVISPVKRKSSRFPYYCKLQDNQLWKIRNLLIAGGLNVPKSKQKVDVNKLVGRTIGITVDDTEFEDKEQSEITAVFPAAELADVDVVPDDSDYEVEEVADDLAEDTDIDESYGDEPEEDAEEDAEEEEEGETGDEWDAITDRLELRKALKKVAPDVKTSTSMSEDDIRDLIRKHSAPKAAPKKAKAAVSDEELEELDIDDL